MTAGRRSLQVYLRAKAFHTDLASSTTTLLAAKGEHNGASIIATPTSASVQPADELAGRITSTVSRRLVGKGWQIKSTGTA